MERGIGSLRARRSHGLREVTPDEPASAGLAQRPREGDVAFAISVGTLYDLTIGQVGWPVRLIRNASPDQPTLTLANRVAGGPVLVVLGPDLDPSNPVFAIDQEGLSAGKVSGYLDLAYQEPAPPTTDLGSDVARLYARAGQLWFKAEGSGEQPLAGSGGAAASGPSRGFISWIGGG